MSELVDLSAWPIWLVEFLALSYVLYRSALSLLSLRRPVTLVQGRRSTRFLVLVPAQNEAAVIADTVRCLKALDYPIDRRLLYVVADSCVDQTENEARSAGAHVLVKPAPASNKGDVLKWALGHREIVAADWDALVIFDGDARPTKDFLNLMDAAIAGGARAVQGRQTSLDQQGLIPRGYAVNVTSRNRLWHQAREAAGFSAAITGSGVCLTRELLTLVPPSTETLTEDLEYTAKLARAGIRVRYLYDATTYVEQPPTLAPSVRQRVRWARGQLRTFVLHGPSLVWKSLRELNLSSLDMALYLLIPSLVPLQALLLVFGLAELLLGDVWPTTGLPGIPVFVVFAVLALSMTLPFVALMAEKRQASWKDWLAFLFVMATWIPVAIFAAITMFVKTWHRTPRQAEAPSVSVLEAVAPMMGDDERSVRAKVTR